MRINSPFVIIHAAIISVFVVATGRAPAAEIPNIKLSDGAAQVLIKQTVCEGAVALIVGLRAAGQIKGVLARLPDNVAKTATKLAHTRLMILHADTKTVHILMKDQDVLTVHQNLDPKHAKEEIMKARRKAKGMKELKAAVDLAPVPVIVALALSEDASPADIAKTGKALLDSLSGLGVNHVKSFKYIPHVGMVVGKPALQALTTSPLVCGVHLDQQARPL